MYFSQGQYTAALEQSEHRWHLQPMQEAQADVIYAGNSCASRQPIPHGVWFVTRDADRNPQLVAPSSTVLPSGYPEQLPLRLCGDRPDNRIALYVPAVVFDWLNGHVGSVMIDE